MYKVKKLALWCPNCHKVVSVKYIDAFDMYGNPKKVQVGDCDKEDLYSIETEMCTECQSTKMIEIDERLLCIIQALNVKGYPTIYSCEGHYFDNKKEHAEYLGCDIDRLKDIDEGPAVANFYITFPAVVFHELRNHGGFNRTFFTWKDDGLYKLTVWEHVITATIGSKEKFEEFKNEYLKSLEETVAKLPMAKKVQKQIYRNK